MGSVKSVAGGGGSYISTSTAANLPGSNGSGNWTLGFWVKILSFASQYTQAFTYRTTGGVNDFMGADTGEFGTTTQLDGYANADGSPAQASPALFTGSD